MISTEKTRKHFTKLTIVKYAVKFTKSRFGNFSRVTYQPNQRFGVRSTNPGDATPGLDWSSKKEHKADALALGADEGRDKLR